MTDDRDPMLGRRLDDLPTPDHRPGFWADLRLELDQDPNATLNPGGRAGSVENEEPLSLDAARVRREGRSAPALVAAAVLLLALVAAGVVLTRDDTDRSVDLAADRVDDATIATAPTGRSAPARRSVPARARRWRSIRPAGSSMSWTTCPATSWAARVATTSPVRRTDRRRDRRPAVAGVEVGGAGRTDLVFGPDGDVVVITSCEGFTSRVVVGTVGDDGTIEDVSVLDRPLPISPAARTAAGIWSTSPGRHPVSSWPAPSTTPTPGRSAT